MLDPGLYRDWQEWARQLMRLFGTPGNAKAPLQLYQFTVASAPAATSDGLLGFCTDEAGGPVPVYSEGGVWKRVTDGATIS